MVEVYPPDSKPGDRTYRDWLEDYTKILLQTEKRGHPSYDRTGEFCTRLKKGGAYMLFGTFEGSAERKLDIPAGTDLFVCPVLKNDSYAESLDIQEGDEAALKGRTEEGMRYVTEKFLKVDGTEVQNLDKFVVETSVFEMHFPDGPVYDVQPGLTKAVATGCGVMLKALSRGSHTLEFGFEARIPRDSKIYEHVGKGPAVKEEATGKLYKMKVKYTVNVT